MRSQDRLSATCVPIGGRKPKNLGSRKASAALHNGLSRLGRRWWENAGDEIWEADRTNTNKLGKKSEMINRTNKQLYSWKQRPHEYSKLRMFFSELEEYNVIRKTLETIGPWEYGTLFSVHKRLWTWKMPKNSQDLNNYQTPFYYKFGTKPQFKKQWPLHLFSFLNHWCAQNQSKPSFLAEFNNLICCLYTTSNVDHQSKLKAFLFGGA